MKWLPIVCLIVCALALSGVASTSTPEKPPAQERDGACLRCIPW